jgi:hypothetical protein
MRKEEKEKSKEQRERQEQKEKGRMAGRRRIEGSYKNGRKEKK